MNVLIGHTGFIGSNLKSQFEIDMCYNSSNIKTIKDKEIDHLICAGLPGVKWLANKYPDRDIEKISLLRDSIKNLKPRRLTFISSIDVYKNPVNVNEDSKTSLTHHAYGSHRTDFENFIIKNFHNVRCLRLPVVYGKGFKKNYLYDLINDNNLEKICLNSEVQFYNVDNLKKDIEFSWNIDTKVINISSEPIKILKIVERCFSDKKNSCKSNKEFKTNMRTKFSKTGYFYNKTQVLESIEGFLN
jgi:nucleoside-diphosphate-sugar epimerase